MSHIAVPQMIMSPNVEDLGQTMNALTMVGTQVILSTFSAQRTRLIEVTRYLPSMLRLHLQ